MSNKQPPWITHPKIWKTKASFFSWLRGGIRRSLWNRSPIKISFINKHRKRIPNPNPKGKVKEVWGATCAICKQDFPINFVDVDHCKGNHSLLELSDIQTFIENIVLVAEDDLQFCCKNCHKIKTQSERKGISFEEARIEKEAIRICKEKKDLIFFEERGIIPATSQAKRRKQIENVLLEELDNGR